MTTQDEFQARRVMALEIIAQAIPRKYLAQEAELLILKWPAYRFLSPLAATKLFHIAYIDGYREYLRKNIDYESAGKTRVGARLKFDRQNAHLTQLWAARQIADSLGIPYDAYMEFVFDFASRRKRRKPPQPNQLGPNPKTEVAWYAKLKEYWTPECKKIWMNRMLPLAQYSRDHDKRLPAQEQFRRDLIDTERAVGGSLTSFVGKRVVALNQLISSECGILGEDAVDKAMRDAQHDVETGLLSIHEYAQPHSAELMQSCFGVPGIMTSLSEPCQRCPHLSLCDRLRNHVLRTADKTTGHSDPIQEEAKRKTRERVARHRERKKNGQPQVTSPAPGAEISSLAGVAEISQAGKM